MDKLSKHISERTSINIDKRTRGSLRKIKIYRRETYDEALRRLLEIKSNEVS